MTSPTEELKTLSAFLKGAALMAADPNLKERLLVSSEWLQKLSVHICGQGFIGCLGGPSCESSHK